MNYTMLFDFYEITMANGYFNSEYKDIDCVFDVFFRRIPDNGGYCVFAGLESIVNYIQNIKFTKADIEYLRNKNMFCEEFLSFLEGFKFNGSLYSFPEGTIMFPGEPIMTIVAKTIEAQFIETYILLSINHQALIATKTRRIVYAAGEKTVVEFGARRAHGESAAINGARAAYISGTIGSSNTMAEVLFGIPALGTMAHSWISMFDSEYDAFVSYCKTYPENATLLVDTYSTLKSGVPNAIKAIKEVLHPLGYRKCGIRIDSGDVGYLAKKARVMLDKAGLTECLIVVSNSLDEIIIGDLRRQGAPIDLYGVGERLITSRSEPVLGCVYKLAAVKTKDKFEPKIKVSDNIEKITNPGLKKVYRLFCKDHKAIADLITKHDEVIDFTKPLTIFNPSETWKRKELVDYYAKELLVPIILEGKLVYNMPTLREVREYAQLQFETLWEETTRIVNPHEYYVDLSEELWTLRRDMIEEWGKK